MLISNEEACRISGVGNYYANVPAESFFASLKKGCLRSTSCAIRTEAYYTTERYIDGFNSPIRRHSAIGYINPIDYEHSMTATAAACETQSTVRILRAIPDASTVNVACN